MIDYLLDRAAYIDAFMKNINWDTVNQRYQP
jgi:superoxide dismutase